jgi:hypothetical protein
MKSVVAAPQIRGAEPSCHPPTQHDHEGDDAVPRFLCSRTLVTTRKETTRVISACSQSIVHFQSTVASSRDPFLFSALDAKVFPSLRHRLSPDALPNVVLPPRTFEGRSKEPLRFRSGMLLGAIAKRLPSRDASRFLFGEKPGTFPSGRAVSSVRRG